jgi:DNA-binding NarL/FixJ family response regulator
LLKDASPERLMDAIRVVAAGDALIAPSITRRLIVDFARRSASPLLRDTKLEHLTVRETDVLVLIGQGLNNREVAARLHVSETTVKTHVGRVLGKLELRDRVQAVILAYEAGLVFPARTPLPKPSSRWPG